MRAIACAAALTSATIALAVGCGGEASGAAPPPCPEGALDQPARADATIALLASVPEGAAIVGSARAQIGRVCFGAEHVSAITEERTIVLERALAPGEAAARLGHLMLHARDGLPYRAGPDCDEVVARALDAEAEAHALELRLRRALSVEPRVLTYDFEQAFWSAPERTRTQVIRDWLEAHPEGGGGVDALAAGYRQRCEHERARAGGP